MKWSKPPEGWYKLNSDGASCGNPGKAGGGGLIRDCNGSWFKGFVRSIRFAIGLATIITAEFWALRDGLFGSKWYMCMGKATDVRMHLQDRVAP